MFLNTHAHVSSSLRYYRNVDRRWYQSFPVRASPSAGASTGKTIHTLGKTNYSAWSDRIQANILSYELWDLVTGDRTRPVIPTAIHNTAGTAAANQANIDIVTKYLKDYMKDFRTASRIILNSISDEQVAYIKPVITDPVAVLEKTQKQI